MPSKSIGLHEPIAEKCSSEVAPTRMQSGSVPSRRASGSVPIRIVSGLSESSSWHGGDLECHARVDFQVDPRHVQSLHADFRPEQPWRIPKQMPNQLSWGRDPETRKVRTFVFEAVSIFSNILAGPGILQFPEMVVQSGWVVSLAVLLIFAILTAKTSCMLAKALRQMSLKERQTSKSAVPRYELSDLVRETFGYRSFLAFQVLLNLGMLLLCLASVVAAGSTVDRLLTVLFGNSYALSLSGSGPVFSPACLPSMDRSSCGTDLFSTTSLGISAGYIVVFLICLPLTFTNFANLMWFQYVALTVTAASVLIFVVTCFAPSSSQEALWHVPPAFGASPGFAVSTCFLSFAIGFAVPSWWNENEPDCPASLAINASVAYTFFFYYLPVAFLPAFAFVIPAGKDALWLFLNPKIVNTVAVAGAYVLAIAGIMPNVIAYSVAMRDNLQSLGPRFTFNTSLLIGCVGPFLIGWALDNPTGFGETFQLVVNWAALAMLGGINFIVPLLIVIKLAGQQDIQQVSSKIDVWTRSEVLQAKALLVVSSLLVVGGYAMNIAV